MGNFDSAVSKTYESRAAQELEAADFLVRPEQAVESEKRTMLQEAVHSAVGLVCPSESQTRNDVETFASQLIAAVPLFIGGSRGFLATTTLFGFNQAKYDDTTSHQIQDFALGALKGVGTKAMFNHFGAKNNWNLADKGIAMGASSRGMEVGLNRETWFNQAGSFQPFSGLGTTAKSMLHPAALATDVLTFGAAHYGVKFANVLSKGAMEASPLWRHAVTGTTFGFSSGALGEVHRQLCDPNGDFDPLKIVARGGASAATMTLAGAAGFKLTHSADVHVVQQRTDSAKSHARPDAIVRSELGEGELRQLDEMAEKLPGLNANLQAFRFNKPHGQIRVAERNQRPVGFVAYSEDADAKGQVYISSLGVDPAFQGQGIGKQLLQTVLSGDYGTTSLVTLAVRSDNVTAINLYRRCGFTDAKTLKDFYGPGHDGVAMYYEQRPGAYQKFLEQRARGDGSARGDESARAGTAQS